MKLSGALLGITALLPSAAGSIVGPLVDSRTTVNNIAGNDCATTVTIDCTFIGPDGTTETCLSAQDPYNNKAVVPHHWYPSNECGETYEATVTATMCNDNAPFSGKSITLFKTNDKNSYVKIKNQEIAFPETTIAPGTCITVTKVVDQVKCKVTPVSVQLQGNMPSLVGNSFCYSFVYNKARSKAIPEPVIISPAPTYTEECTSKSKVPSGINECKSSVSINCEYDGDKSCIGPNEDLLFYNIPLEDCLANPINNVRVQQSMCNENANSPINLNGNSYFRYRGADDVGAVPGSLAPGDCAYSDRQNLVINTCKKNHPMSVQLEGRMTNAPFDGNAYCYCYSFKRGLVEQYPGLAPPNPPREPIDSTVAFITEITDPKGKDAMRYVEIYSPNKAGKKIEENWKLVRFMGTSTSYDRATGISIQGLEFDKNGYLLLCRNVEKYDKCDEKNAFKLLFDGFMTPGLHIAIIDASNNDAIVDVYGRVGTNPLPMGFSDGRVFRNPGVISGSSTYVSSEWTSEAGYYDSATPGCWIGAGDIANCTGKAPSSPSGKGGKGGKGTPAPGTAAREGEVKSPSPKGTDKEEKAPPPPKSSEGLPKEDGPGPKEGGNRRRRRRRV